MDIYYSVAKGRKSGIYRNWDDCKAQVNKYKGAIYKKFNNEQNAIEFLDQCNKEETNDIDYYVYTDGACINNGKNNAQAGIGIYFSKNDARNISRRITGKQTNNVAELSAIIETYNIIKNDIDKGLKIVIVTDSEYSIKCIKDYGKKNDMNNWKSDIPNKELVKQIYNIYKSVNNVSFKHINSHTGKNDIHSLGNEEADKLANLSLGISKCPYERIYLKVSFDKKELAKKLGCKWDIVNKKWYCISSSNNDKILQCFKIDN